MITYINNRDSFITTTPRVEFTDKVPTWFIHEFLRRMSNGQIKVKDSQGNELVVQYD